MAPPSKLVNDRGLRVLVVDDHPHVRAQVICILAAAGFTCAEASDGATAFDMVLDERFDLMVTDLHMPGLDGGQLMAAIGLTPGSARMPVIVISADADDVLTSRRPELRRASAILAKPVSADDLLAAVSGALSRDRNVRSARG